MKAIALNWKTTLAGAVWIALYGLQTAGIEVPGVHLDPSALPLALAMLFAKDANVTGVPPAARKP